jgi:hypothetical protein
VTHFIPIETPGGTIWAEVEEIDDVDSVKLTGNSPFQSFDAAVEAMKQNAVILLNSLKTLEPEEVEVSFGIKAGAEAGTPFFGLAKASAEASYSVKLVWRPKNANS